MNDSVPNPKSPSLVGVSELAHYRFLQSLYLVDLVPGPPILLCSSKRVAHYFLNHAYWIGSETSSVSQHIDSIVAFFEGRGRKPWVYLSPTVTTPDLESRLQMKGFSKSDDEEWMFRRVDRPPMPRVHDEDQYSVRALAESELAMFVELFDRASGLESGFGQAMKEAWLRPRGSAEIAHYGCFADSDNELVGGISCASADGVGGIYNFTCSLDTQLEPIGAGLVSAVVEDLVGHGSELVFLQAEHDGAIAQLFTSLGFDTSFVRVGYEL